jgi:hypothetical protein
MLGRMRAAVKSNLTSSRVRNTHAEELSYPRSYVFPAANTELVQKILRVQVIERSSNQIRHRADRFLRLPQRRSVEQKAGSTT